MTSDLGDISLNRRQQKSVTYTYFSPFFGISIRPRDPRPKKKYVCGVLAWLNQMQSLFCCTPSFMAHRGQNNSKFSTFLELNQFAFLQLYNSRESKMGNFYYILKIYLQRKYHNFMLKIWSIQPSLELSNLDTLVSKSHP